jgi:hypothetical protein
MRSGGVPLGELFAFLSGLYFRGKLTYASVFADPPPGSPAMFIITPCYGLKEPIWQVTGEDMIRFATAEIHQDREGYAEPFQKDAERLARFIRSDTEIVLLGSIATRKYLDILLASFGPRLHFPEAFIGRGDMSRGGLLLRSAASRQELRYVAAEGALLHGKRPPKLTPAKPAKAREVRKQKGKV